ncbi:MAG: slipin family protein [Spirochaetales bacterium]|nr:MAG: slipin family protein [Spirochaetales bacterium]
MSDSPRSNGFLGRFFGHSDSVHLPRHRGNFRFNTISVLALVIFMGLAIGLQVTFGERPDPAVLAEMVAGVVAASGLLLLLPYWPVALMAIAASWGVLPVLSDVDLSIASGILSLGFLIAPGIELVREWDKIVVLRLGRYHKVRGPGLLFVFPLIDSVAGYIDTRIRATDFSAEKSLTRDTVPVHVDALAFWMIWDAGKAILEVQDFESAVTLSAQTALRASIGANELSTLLSERERLGEEIQKLVDAKTNPWGITILSVEFKEILIPRELEDSLSKEAQASRERNARIILGSTEAEIAKTFKLAADEYRDDPVALQLRAMNMVYESIRNKGGLVLMPSSALESMNLGTVLGTKAYVGQTGIGTDGTIPEGAGTDVPEGGGTAP